MPLYDYKCSDCSEVTEVLIGSSDNRDVQCPSCGTAMRRQVSAPSFRLKGGGWYETDFKAEGRRNIAGEGADSGKSGEKSSDAKSDKSGGEKASSNPSAKSDAPAPSSSTSGASAGKGASGAGATAD